LPGHQLGRNHRAYTILFPAAAQGQADQGTVVIRVTAEGKPLDEAASSFVIVRKL
jgi:hypothetical protein